MAVLEKIRVRLGILITVLIAVALLSFIIDPSTIESTMRYFSSKYDVGNIDGKKITYQDFQSELDYYNHIYQLTSGSQSTSEEQMRAINETAWQNLISEYLIIPEMQKAGINVGDDEMVDLSNGKEISPILLQDPVFCDATGQFSRDQLMQFIHAVATDASGNLSTYWNFLQNNMQNAQYYAKYVSLINNSAIVTPVELRRQIDENNTSSDAEFVLVPFGFKADTTIKVSDKEIRDYYNAHKNNYKRTASRDVEFVAYDVVPSENDITAAEEEINGLFEEFATAKNLKSFLSLNSDTPLSDYFYKQGELASQDAKLDSFAFDKKATILPVYRKDNTFYAARINATRQMSDSAFVRHILLPFDAEAKADSLMGVLKKGADFSTLAQENSLDKNHNAENPGEIGWMTQNMMINGLQDVLTMKPGSFAIMRTDYGIHVVNVTKRTAPMQKVQLAILTKEAVPSNETHQYYYAQANNLASRAEGKIANFDKITEEEDLPVIPVNNVRESARQLSRYDDVKEVIRWIYDDKTKEGSVSQIIDVKNNTYFVVAVKKIKEEGYTPVNEVAASIKYQLTNKKRAEKIKAEVAEKIAGLNDMTAVADALDKTVSTKTGLTFGSLTSNANEPAFIGAVAGAELNTVSGPVAGNSGVYVLNVTNRETGAFYTEDDAKIKTKQTQAYLINSLMSIFNERGDIKDNRARFF